MSSKTLEIPGTVKVVRAIKDLVYQGKTIRGKRSVRVDGALGGYEITPTPGEEFECDQTYAKRVCMTGEAVLVSGGAVEVIPQADGYPIYKSWIKNISDPVPVFERCELLQPLFFGQGCILPVGTKCRLNTAAFFDRSKFCYEEEQQTDAHATRILRPSPKRVKQVAVEQSIMIAQLMAQVFPGQPI